MLGMISNIRVNYTISELIVSCFISENSEKYRTLLKSYICDYFNVENVLLTSSGRCALYMLMRHLPQRKVLIPSYTCQAVEDAVRLAGKEIYYIHVDRQTLNAANYLEIDNDTIVIATHQYGLACNIEEIAHICNSVGAVLIEDCAGSFGTRIKGKLTGTFGDYGIFSFSASKTIHSPTKGGFIISNKYKLEDINSVLSLKKTVFSFKIRQILKGIGFCLNNYHIGCYIIHRLKNRDDSEERISRGVKNVIEDTYYRTFYEWQAYVVCKQFNRLNLILVERKTNALFYQNKIKNSHIEKIQHDSESINIRFVLLSKYKKELIKLAKKEGIELGKGYKRAICPESYIEDRRISNEIIYLPFGNGYTKRELNKISCFINKFKP